MRRPSRQWPWVALGVSVVVAALLLGVWGLTRSSSVHAAPIFSERHVPVSTIITNTCGGEDVALTGDMQTVIHATTDGAGGFHFDVQINYQGVSGVGQTSGAKYQLSGGHHSSFNTPASGGIINTDREGVGRLIGQGPDNNQLFTFQAHFTITPDGTTTTSFSDFDFVCH